MDWNIIFNVIVGMFLYRVIIIVVSSLIVVIGKELS